jgi:hypothetical protein
MARAKDWLQAAGLGALLWLGLLLLLFFAGNLATSRFIYVDF